MSEKVFLEKIEGPKYLSCYCLRVRDTEINPPEDNRGHLALTFTYLLDGVYPLFLRTPERIRWRSISDDKLFGIAKTLEEADKKIYKRLLSEAPNLIKENRFDSFEDNVSNLEQSVQQVVIGDNRDCYTS